MTIVTHLLTIVRITFEQHNAHHTTYIINSNKFYLSCQNNYVSNLIIQPEKDQKTKTCASATVEKEQDSFEWQSEAPRRAPDLA